MTRPANVCSVPEWAGQRPALLYDIGLAGKTQRRHQDSTHLDANSQREILRRWLLALGCFASLIFFFSPTWGAFRIWSRVPEMGGMIEVRRGESVLLQVAHPGIELPDKLHAAIQWRLLFPVIAHVLNLPPMILFALADVGCVIVLAFIIAVLRRRGASFGFAGLAAIVLGAGSWYFTSVCWLGYFDSWLVFGLLLVAFADSAWPVWLACAWAPWVDERFVLAAPLALFCRYVDRTRAGKPFAWKQELGAPVALLAVFVIVRLGVLGAHSAAGATVAGYFSGLENGGATWTRMAFGIWEGLRVGWLGVAAAVLLLPRERGIVIGAAVVVLVAIGLGTAQDYSRAMMLMLPAGLLGVVLAVGRIATYPRWLPVVAAILALVLPAHHVMSNWVNPIYYLYHELAALRSPPAGVMPEVFELRAVEEMEQGEFAHAADDLTLAIKLADNPAGPSRHRGLLAASLGRWEDARRDFSVAVEHAPENPEGWFLRAQAELALGQVAAARSDVEEARSRAPADWKNRPDVGRFLTRLNQAGGK